MTRPRVQVLIAVLLAASLASAALAAGEVVVTAVVGKVQCAPKKGSGWSQARVGTRLPAGAQMWTARGSLAELRFPDGTAFRLGPESSVTLTGTNPAGAGIARGSLLARIVKGSLVQVKGRYGAATVRGTQFEYKVTDEGETLRTWDGLVEFGREGQKVSVAEGMGSWLFPFGGPGAPRSIAPVQFAGGQFQPGWNQLRSGADQSSNQGTEGQRALMDQTSDAQQALLSLEPGRGNLGNLDVELQRARSTQIAHGAALGAGAFSQALAGALTTAAAAQGGSHSNGLERSVGDWLWGPVGAFGAYAMWGDAQSVAGARAKVSAVVNDVYVQAAARYAISSDDKGRLSLDETFAAIRRRDLELQAGRLRLLEGPASNSDIGSLLPPSTVDGARAGVALGSHWRGVFSWMHNYDSLFETDRTGAYGRVQCFVGGGWLGLAAMNQTHASTGFTGQFSLPLGNHALELYGELGDDPQGHHLETLGMFFPNLYYNDNLNLHIERATRADYDTLYSMHAYYELSKNRWLVGLADHSELDGTRVGAGLMFLFDGL